MKNTAERVGNLFTAIPAIEHPDVRIGRACLATILAADYEDKDPQSHQSMANFVDDTLQLFQEVDLPPTLDKVDVSKTLPGKRYPTTRETLHATLERYKTLLYLRDAFEGHTIGALYGGSMAYGPFFNVRSGKDASDIDLIMQVDQDNLPKYWDSLLESEVLTEEDSLTFTARIPLFQSLLANGQAEVLSQRFNIADTDYNCSIHFMTQSALDSVFGIGLQEALLEEKPYKKTKYIADYKGNAFERTACTNYDLSGRPQSVPVISEPVDGGFIAHIPAYTITEGRFAPGLYQCLALPQTRLAYPSAEAFVGLQDTFKTTIEARSARERVEHDPAASIDNVDPRRFIFPPRTEEVMHEYGL
jgi:hypothetical protein